MIFYRNLSRLARVLPIIFVSVLSLSLLGSSCKTIPVVTPPACPVWSEEAISELEFLYVLQELGEIDMESLYYQLGENQRHCEALDVYLEGT